METLLATLVLWLRSNTEVDIHELPAIHIASPEELEARYGVPVYGLYSGTTRELWISSDVDLTTQTGASVLVHELVHHWQTESGKLAEYECLRASERLAYDIQTQYLRDKEQPVPRYLNGFSVLVLSSCTYQ